MFVVIEWATLYGQEAILADVDGASMWREGRLIAPVAIAILMLLAACQSGNLVTAPARFADPATVFDLDVTSINAPVLLRYRPFDRVSFHAVQELTARLDSGQTLVRIDRVEGVIHAKPAGEGLLQMTASFVVVRSEHGLRSPARAIEFIGLITDLGELRDGGWRFDASARLTPDEKAQVFETVADLWPFALWPEVAITPEVAFALNRIGEEASSDASFQLRGSRSQDGERALVFSFEVGPRQRAQVRDGRDVEMAVAIAGYFAVDPAIGMVTEFENLATGEGAFEGEIISFSVSTRGGISRP